MVRCNFTTHVICLLAFMVYKYSELQMSNAIQKLIYKASCKTPLFFIVMYCENIPHIPNNLVNVYIFKHFVT